MPKVLSSTIPSSSGHMNPRRASLWDLHPSGCLPKRRSCGSVRRGIRANKNAKRDVCRRKGKNCGCSESGMGEGEGEQQRQRGGDTEETNAVSRSPKKDCCGATSTVGEGEGCKERSEERRVGKECRS